MCSMRSGHPRFANPVLIVVYVFINASINISFTVFVCCWAVICSKLNVYAVIILFDGSWSGVLTQEDHQGMSPALSQCARFAPRFNGAVRRFALRPLATWRHSTADRRAGFRSGSWSASTSWWHSVRRLATATARARQDVSHFGTGLLISCHWLCSLSLAFGVWVKPCKA